MTFVETTNKNLIIYYFAVQGGPNGCQYRIKDISVNIKEIWHSRGPNFGYKLDDDVRLLFFVSFSIVRNLHGSDISFYRLLFM